jgi:penicillin V acylase-like amidase (Ntn superfamily)
VFGRNYDWITGTGMVCVNLKGLSKTSMKTQDGETTTWISKYGSISFNQYGKEFPTGGMNEKGLVVELMWLDETKYPAPDNRPAIGVLQWIQYQLDNCATIDELIATDKKIRIASKGTAPLHYLVADATGSAATIEFLDGKMTVHKGSDLPFPVLTNSVYDQSAQSYKLAASSSGGGSSFAFGNNSLDRFANACAMVKKFQQQENNVPVIDYSFSILSKVAQGSHTKWSIVYDISNKKVYFKTQGFPEVKTVAFSAFEFDCKSAAKSYDMNQAGTGDISNKFEPFTIENNERIVEKSFTESKSQINVNEDSRKAVWGYPRGIICAGQEGGN